MIQTLTDLPLSQAEAVRRTKGLGKPTRTYEYSDAAGDPVMWIVRFEKPGVPAVRAGPTADREERNQRGSSHRPHRRRSQAAKLTAPSTTIAAVISYITG